MSRTRGFTLIEILIVVVLLAVVATVVVPTVARSGTPAREGVLAANLSMLRRFVLVYSSHHQETGPGYTAGPGSALSAEVFADQAMLSSNVQGETAARGTAGYPYGPYLSKVPANPFNGLATIRMVADGEAMPAAADNSHGWIYKAATGQIRPGNSGTDEAGIAYYDY